MVVRTLEATPRAGHTITPGHGTASRFAALDVKTGKVVGGTLRRHRARQLRQS